MIIVVSMTLMRPLLVLALLIGLAIFSSACRPAIEDDIDELQVDVARLAEANARAQILAALEPLDPLGYHHLDSVVRNEGRIPADAVIWATRAREALSWVDWPAELQPHVDQYAEWLDSLLAAFRLDDAAAAAEPSRITHALAHTFEVAMEAWLNNDALPAVPELAGLEPPAHDEDEQHDHEMSMSDDDGGHEGMSMSDDEDQQDHSGHSE